MIVQDTAMTKPRVIGLAAAARRFNVSYQTLIEWVKTGKLTELWEGRQRVALVDELARLQDERLRDKPQASDVLGEYIREDQPPVDTAEE